MDTPEIPFMIYAEETPNPASMKFVANKTLMPQGATAQYSSVAEAKGSPLALKLFEFPFVRQVFITANYLTVTRAEFVSWDDVLIETRGFITSFLNTKGNVAVVDVPTKNLATDTSFKETTTVFTEHAAPKNQTEAKIIEVLEQYIRPAVEQDGGMIVFKELNDGVVTVKMKGACSGCPSSTLTLKAGIEGLLKRLLPDDVKEVVSEA